MTSLAQEPMNHYRQVTKYLHTEYARSDEPIAHVRAFFNWLAKEGLIQDSPARSLKPPKVASKVVSTLSDEEIGAVLDALKPTNPCNPRNQTIFMPLLDTELRLGELAPPALDLVLLPARVSIVAGAISFSYSIY